MLYYDRTDFSEETDISKTSATKECDICHYCYVLNKGFKFHQGRCNGCHDLLKVSMNLSNIDILNIKCAEYCCIISGISKSEAINLMKNVDLRKKEKSGTL